MIDVFGNKIQHTSVRGQKVPGSHIWYEVQGTVEVDGQPWHGRLYCLLTPGDSDYIESDHFEFWEVGFRDSEGWNVTTITFASLLGNLTIDTTECVDCCGGK